ncbi:MAG: pyruvate kinase [Gammaproteobacteria bacterium]|nr:pyruvate kinase [Gammaproteobacteria bacterium]
MTNTILHRKTKIIATIGPASDSVEILTKMIEAGMNVARLNMSFGVDDVQQNRLDRIRQVAKNMGRSIAIMADTKGIEIRTGKLVDATTELNAGDNFILYSYTREGNSEGVSVNYANLHNEVSKGTPILLNDGAIELEVDNIEQTHGGEVHCRIIHGGLLRENKSVNLPDTQLNMTAVSPENQEEIHKELTFAAENNVDYIAASFVQDAEDVIKMRAILADRGVEIPIIAKIENRAGIENLNAIVAVADGTMVARGDLGVELPLADVPAMQKRIIQATVTNGKPVITATEMLASMEANPKPTRAEASDVANAILDGTSAIMLSGETAMGDYPVESVKMMSSIAVRAESSLKEFGYLQNIKPHHSNVVTEAVSQAAITMANHLKATAIISLTESGFTSRQISKYRPESLILAVTGQESVVLRSSMNWGVFSILYKEGATNDEKLEYALEEGKNKGFFKPLDILVVTAGPRQEAGGTNMVRVINVPE